MKTNSAWHSGHELSEESIASLCRRSSEEMGIRPTVELAAIALAWHIDAYIIRTAITYGVDRNALRRAVCEQIR
jgi:hypothetical protein